MSNGRNKTKRKMSDMFVTGNKCAVWWGSARAHTDSVQKVSYNVPETG